MDCTYVLNAKLLKWEEVAMAHEYARKQLLVVITDSPPQLCSECVERATGTYLKLLVGKEDAQAIALGQPSDMALQVFVLGIILA